MEKLAEYLKTHSAQGLADQIGVHRAQVYRWAKGESEPGVKAALRLEDATGGAVPVRSWVEYKEAAMLATSRPTDTAL